MGSGYEHLREVQVSGQDQGASTVWGIKGYSVRTKGFKPSLCGLVWYPHLEAVLLLESCLSGLFISAPLLLQEQMSPSPSKTKKGLAGGPGKEVLF